MRGSGRVFQRPNSRNWWISYCHRGKEIRESSRSPKKSVAKRLLRQRLMEIGADSLGLTRFVGPAQERVTVKELLDALEADYKIRGIRSLPQVFAHLRPIRIALGEARALALSAVAVDRYITDRLGQGRTPSTVNRETQLLGQAFRLAVENKRLNFSPKIRRLPERNVRQGFFEATEFETLANHLPEYLHDLVRFAYLTGWRKAEIASLTWADLDREGRVIRLRGEESKTGEPRMVALEGELWAIVERRWLARQLAGPGREVRLSPWVFHRVGRRIGDFRKVWASATRAAGVPGKLFHDLRRTAIRNMVRAGVTERVAMQISGHRTRAVFDRYNITSERDLRLAMRKTDTYLRARTSRPRVVSFKRSKDTTWN